MQQNTARVIPFPEQTSTPPAPRIEEVLMQVASGYMMSSAFYVVLSLEIPELLKDGPRTSTFLAEKTGSNEDRLYRVMRALSSAGVFAEVRPRIFALTDMSELLTKDGQFHDIALFLSEPSHVRIFEELAHNVKTGQPAVERAYGVTAWELFEKDEKLGQMFNAAMTSLSNIDSPTVVDAYDFSNCGTLIDVAGGHGRLITTILREYPKLQGILFDLPHVLAGAGNHLSEFDGRCRVVAGSFFDSVPSGDTIIMKHIIHDWQDGDATRILKNCHKALASSDVAKLLLCERIVPEGPEPHLAKIADLEMMAFPNGRERTEREFRNLLAGAGFRLTGVIPTVSTMSIIEAARS